MLRALLMTLVPLFLPLAVFWLWRTLYGSGPMPEWMRKGPWVSLFAIGVVLAGLTLVAWSLVSGAPPGSTYIAPQFDGQKITPGRYE